jgi:hypothetical protein
MMKRISLLVLLAGLSYGQVTNVIATKSVAPFWVVPSATMPFDTWTNSALWITAESPVLNATTSNANWICYAKNCSGNATQSATGPRPERIYTNNTWSLVFDGVDDCINFPAMMYTNLYASGTWFIKFKVIDKSNNRNYWAFTGKTLAEAVGSYRNNACRFQWKTNGTHEVRLKTAGTGSDNTFTVAFGTNSSLYKFAISLSNSTRTVRYSIAAYTNFASAPTGHTTSQSSIVTTNTINNFAPVTIGRGSFDDAYQYYSSMDIYECYFLPNIFMSTNEMKTLTGAL